MIVLNFVNKKSVKMMEGSESRIGSIHLFCKKNCSDSNGAGGVHLGYADELLQSIGYRPVERQTLVTLFVADEEEIQERVRHVDG